MAWARLAVGAVAAAALVALAVNTRPEEHFKAAGPLGTIQAVTLKSGQVFYGTLKSQAGGVVVLTDVYEPTNVVDPQTNQRTTQLNPRRAMTWHAPLDMAIPMSEILFTESVGRDSQAAKTMAAPPSPAPTPPPAK